MAFGIGMKLEGVEAVIARLRDLDERVARKALKKGVDKASQRIVKDARSRCPVDQKRAEAAKTFRKVRAAVRKGKASWLTATAEQDQLASGVLATEVLKRSLGRTVKVYRRGEYATAFAAIGPRNGYRVQTGVVSRGKNKGKPIYQDPANITHLVEYGHGGKHPAAAKPFLRPALDGNKAACLQDVADAVAAEMT